MGRLGDGELRTMVIHERREERENGGITCCMNEEGRLIRARENNQQLTTATSGHINIRLWQLKACSRDQGRRGEHRHGVN